MIPTLKDLKLAYEKLLHLDPLATSLSDLARYSQWSRFDPRLGELWIAFVRRNWKEINPSEFGEALRQERWPAAAAVLLEFAGKPPHTKTLPHWCKIITEGMEKGRSEQFFVGLRRLGGEGMWEDALYATSEYRKWGYLARENLLRVQGTVPMDKIQRKEVLQSLIQRSPRIMTHEYWQAIGKCVSKRQAERDLKESPLLRPYGKTKGRGYRRKGSGILSALFILRSYLETRGGRPRR